MIKTFDNCVILRQIYWLLVLQTIYVLTKEILKKFSLEFVVLIQERILMARTVVHIQSTAVVVFLNPAGWIDLFFSEPQI